MGEFVGVSASFLRVMQLKVKSSTNLPPNPTTRDVCELLIKPETARTPEPYVNVASFSSEVRQLGIC